MNHMKLLIIADAFPPMRTSAAIHIYDLASELIKQHHLVTVITPSPLNQKSLVINNYDGIRLVSILTPKVKDVRYLRRVLAEYISPLIMYLRLKRSRIIEEEFDGLIWYSPTIFFGPLVARLKKRYNCPTYLVLRDMFPDWAVDLGIMKKRLPYYFLKLVEYYQYKVADHIGVQAQGNFIYFENKIFKKFRPKIELLWTWVRPSGRKVRCSIDLQKTHLAGRKIFVYAGNMGIAQDFELIFNLIELYQDNINIGFLFVGRGSEAARLRLLAKDKSLANIIFYDEIDPLEIPELYAQCDIGLVSLDPRHKSHNIPGKFLSYMSSGIPVLGRLNANNDLIKIVNENNVGECYSGYDSLEFKSKADALLKKLETDHDFSNNCIRLAKYMFSAEKAAKQIVSSISQK